MILNAKINIIPNLSLLISVGFHILVSYVIFLLVNSNIDNTENEFTLVDLIPQPIEEISETIAPEKNNPPNNQLDKIFDKNIIKKPPPDNVSDQDSPKNEIDNSTNENAQVLLEEEINNQDENYTYNRFDNFSLTKQNTNQQTIIEKNPEDFIPESIAKDLYSDYSSPNITKQNNLQYVLSNYNWSFETYIEQWAKKIIVWWSIPGDYASGLIPNGGSVWISTLISSEGKLESFEITDSGVSDEMESKAIQALISSFEIPPLPEDFPDVITFHWQFIYPKFAPRFNPIKNN